TRLTSERMSEVRAIESAAILCDRQAHVDLPSAPTAPLLFKRLAGTAALLAAPLCAVRRIGMVPFTLEMRHEAGTRSTDHSSNTWQAMVDTSLLVYFRVRS